MRNRLRNRRVLWLVPLLLAADAQILRAAGWQSYISECWNDNRRNTQLSCFLSDGVFRMTKSRQDCVAEAVRAAQQDNRDLALRWLAACQCGNEEARRAIRAAGGAAVDYAVASYRLFVR